MPRTSKKTSESIPKSGSGTRSNGKSSPGNNKGQAPVNIKVPTAREKARDFDEGRRNDAYSNEL